MRAIAVTGFGGLGKTALIGRWLKTADGHLPRRDLHGVFFWSFYRNRNVDSLFVSLRGFAESDLGFRPPSPTADGLTIARLILRACPVLLVLDGLEVLQERPGSSAYGEILEDALRRLLVAACRDSHASLVVLTSRFPLIDLTRYLGASFRALDLDHLTSDEGADLLRSVGVAGDDHDLSEAGRHLDGHPLALRVLAATALARPDADTPWALARTLSHSRLRGDVEPLSAKLDRLLHFYSSTQPPKRVALLSLIALFRFLSPRCRCVPSLTAFPR